MSKLGNYGLKKQKKEEKSPQPKQTVTPNNKPVIPFDVTKAKQFLTDPCARPC
jgi:hypothetical protein